MVRIAWFGFALLCSGLVMSADLSAATYYVGPAGVDDAEPGRGTSQSNAWRSIGFAVKSIPDGHHVLEVLDGTYANPEVDLSRTFTTHLTIRAQHPYRAVLTNTGGRSLFRSFGGANYTIEGFLLGSSRSVVQVQIGAESHHFTFRNNIFRDSFNNDLLKINDRATDVLVEGNAFYNQGESDEAIDINAVRNVTVQDNIFFSDYEGSGRTPPGSRSHVVLKNSPCQWDGAFCNNWTRNVVVRRNVFLNWQGTASSNFIRLGEDSTPAFEAQDVVIENNLMIGNSAMTMEAPIAVTASRNVTVRNNTVTGDLPSRAYVMRLDAGAYRTEGVTIDGNVWSDPTGTMGNFVFGAHSGLSQIRSTGNCYWNGGQQIPDSGQGGRPAGALELADDFSAILQDPRLPAADRVILPRYDPGTGAFLSGATTIREEFARLARTHGMPAPGSPLIDAANIGAGVLEDILGIARTGQGRGPDVGAVEFGDQGGAGGGSAPGPGAEAPSAPASERQVVIEVEHFDRNAGRGDHAWGVDTGDAGYSGEGFVRAVPNDGMNLDSEFVGASPELVYQVVFPEAGTYDVWVRGLSFTGDDDSVHIGLDGAAQDSADRIDGFFGGEWTWTHGTKDVAPARLSVETPGAHTVHVWMREDGLRLDKILLHHGETSAPQGRGPDETARPLD